MNIAAYCRVSTDKEDQLNSLEAQKNFFMEYAKKNGHNLVKVYADEGISGTKIKNRKGKKKKKEEYFVYCFWDLLLHLLVQCGIKQNKNGNLQGINKLRYCREILFGVLQKNLK